MPHRGLILGALLASAGATGCTTEGLPLPLPDFGGGDGSVLHAAPDLALPFEPCGPGWIFLDVVGAPRREFPLGGDGTTESDAHVTRDGTGAIVLGSSGGLPEAKGSYRYSMEITCHGPCTVRRVGWVIDTPPNTWVNVATRVVSRGTRLDEGSGWTAHGAGSWVDLQVTDGFHAAQWSVDLFSGANNAGSPSLRWLYACWDYQ